MSSVFLTKNPMHKTNSVDGEEKRDALIKVGIIKTQTSGRELSEEVIERRQATRKANREAKLALEEFLNKN